VKLGERKTSEAGNGKYWMGLVCEGSRNDVIFRSRLAPPELLPASGSFPGSDERQQAPTRANKLKNAFLGYSQAAGFVIFVTVQLE
jgi:hypothetical protein